MEQFKKIEAELGDDFDIRQFHNEVLGTGAVPLQLLEEKIDKGIEGRKVGAPELKNEYKRQVRKNYLFLCSFFDPIPVPFIPC